MHIADLRNAKAMKLFRLPPQLYANGLGNQVSRFHEKSVGASLGGNRLSPDQKSAAEFSPCQQFEPG